MHGYSNEKALKLSMQTKKAHYFSRSRKKLWKKGEKNGFYQNIMQIKIDDDQDCLIYFVSLEGEKASCHVGYKSCFYRELASKNDSFSVDLEYTEQEKVFEPQNVCTETYQILQSYKISIVKFTMLGFMLIWT